MSTVPLVILGAGGFGREVHDVVEAINSAAVEKGGVPKFDVIGFLDDSPRDEYLVAERGLTVLGPLDRLDALPDEVEYVIGIGNGEVRRRLDQRGFRFGRRSPVLVHPRAVVGQHRVTFGPGVIVCAGAVITTNVRLGRHVHLNLNVTVGHDSVLDDYATVNPNASVSGGSQLGSGALVGTGAVVLQGLKVGLDSSVGAAACVVRDVPDGLTVVGVPARAIEPRRAPWRHGSDASEPGGKR
ncbi:hypothetical protein SAMN05660748_1014 [Blastococcus aggregatus]|uniref:PglD N-terminal domain-containing protein n=1 Tax=Blastococcus aggregatus TaxID=38502 RepID=A0A285V435_9ACTN|nr:hypothetical protein SAMN05660748_1014 [Blastococcus aggregatus]